MEFLKEAVKGLAGRATEQFGEASLKAAGKFALGVGGASAAFSMASGVAGSMLGAIPFSPVSGDPSITGAIGSGIKGGLIGGAIGLAATRGGALKQWAKRGADDLGYLIGRQMPQGMRPQGEFGQQLFQKFNAGAGAKIAVNNPIGRRVKEIGGAYKAALSHGSMNARQVAGIGLSAAGLGYSAYSSNALGLAIPSNYGYR